MDRTVSRTLQALRALAAKCAAGVGPTVGVIAGEAGQSYRQTERELGELAEQGQVVELPHEKSDGNERRYLPTDWVRPITVIEAGPSVDREQLQHQVEQFFRGMQPRPWTGSAEDRAGLTRELDAAEPELRRYRRGKEGL